MKIPYGVADFDVLVARHGKDLRLKTYVVVSVGFDRLVGREVLERS